MSAQVQPSWWKTMVRHFNTLRHLPTCWDGYAGIPVSDKNRAFAMKMLAACAPDDPAPQIVPGPEGDIQLEWHLPDMDIEIHIAIR